MIHVIRLLGPALGLVGFVYLFCSPPTFAGAKQLAPRPGIMLVADKAIADPRFHQAVVLLISHDMQHSAGVIINKPTDIQAGILGLGLPALSQLPVYYGGPVEPGRGLLLIRSDDPPEGSTTIIPGIHSLGPRTDTSHLNEYRGVRFFLGYAAWAPGQLAAEIRRGDWHLVPGNADTVFPADAPGLWSRLYAAFEALWI